MSKIALSGPASGTATYTISAPTGATDRTITLPDQTATLITNSSGVLDIGSGQLYKDASGNVGIGTSSPAVQLHVYRNTTDGSAASLRLQNAGTTASYATLDATAGAVQTFLYSDAAGNALGVAGATLRTVSNHPLIFGTNNTERARIDTSGNLLVGTTTNGLNVRLNVIAQSVANPAAMGAQVGTNGAYALGVQNASGTNVGGVIANASTTSYATSSDYRLKHDIAPMTGALAKVAQLKPCTYKWNADDSESQGFIAHELQAVVPDCVTGKKDAVDADGNPVYQGIDTSFLVATLTAAIQEQQAIITALTARVTALEGTQP